MLDCAPLKEHVPIPTKSKPPDVHLHAPKKGGGEGKVPLRRVCRVAGGQVSEVSHGVYVSGGGVFHACSWVHHPCGLHWLPPGISIEKPGNIRPQTGGDSPPSGQVS